MFPGIKSVNSSYCKRITKHCPGTMRSEIPDLTDICKCLRQCLSRRGQEEEGSSVEMGFEDLSALTGRVIGLR